MLKTISNTYTYIFWMVNNTGDLLWMTFENGHNLLCVLVEYNSIFVIATWE